MDLLECNEVLFFIVLGIDWKDWEIFQNDNVYKSIYATAMLHHYLYGY